MHLIDIIQDLAEAWRIAKENRRLGHTSVFNGVGKTLYWPTGHAVVEYDICDSKLGVVREDRGGWRIVRVERASNVYYVRIVRSIEFMHTDYNPLIEK